MNGLNGVVPFRNNVHMDNTHHMNCCGYNGPLRADASCAEIEDEELTNPYIC
jgi:hypothetical protein